MEAHLAKDYINTVVCGDCRDVLAAIPDGCVQTCVTSPPYWSLRDYGLEPTVWVADPECQHQWGIARQLPAITHWNTGVVFDPDRRKTVQVDSEKGRFCVKCGGWHGCLGLEPSPEMYINHLVDIFREVRRVLHDNGTVWLNIGDSYWGGKGRSGYELPHEAEERKSKGETLQRGHQVPGYMDMRPSDGRHPTLKPKDMCLIPQRLAIALQDDGWWVRCIIPWLKPNCMPSSQRDRPTVAHEYFILMSKSRKYYYDQDSIRVEYKQPLNRWGGPTIKEEVPKHSKYLEMQDIGVSSAMRAGRPIRPNKQGRYRRTTDWWMDSLQQFFSDEFAFFWCPTTPYSEAHFATFPEKLIEPCILAGSVPGSIVLDPFGGSGTVGVVAAKHHRDYILIDANPDYCQMAEQRIAKATEQITLDLTPKTLVNVAD